MILYSHESLTWEGVTAVPKFTFLMEALKEKSDRPPSSPALLRSKLLVWSHLITLFHDCQEWLLFRVHYFLTNLVYISAWLSRFCTGAQTLAKVISLKSFRGIAAPQALLRGMGTICMFYLWVSTFITSVIHSNPSPPCDFWASLVFKIFQKIFWMGGELREITEKRTAKNDYLK